MKYFLVLLALLIILSVLYKYCFSPNTNEKFNNAVMLQPNPFVVSKEKAKTVWQRAPVYLQEMKHLISGGKMQQNDSVIFVPYQPGLSYNRGDSVCIMRKNQNDSVAFYTAWYSYNSPDSLAAKEIAYYLLTGISRYDK
jgi:hypothetical protein